MGEPWWTDDTAKRHEPEEIVTERRQVDVLVSNASHMPPVAMTRGVAHVVVEAVAAMAS